MSSKSSSNFDFRKRTRNPTTAPSSSPPSNNNNNASPPPPPQQERELLNVNGDTTSDHTNGKSNDGKRKRNRSDMEQHRDNDNHENDDEEEEMSSKECNDQNKSKAPETKRKQQMVDADPSIDNNNNSATNTTHSSALIEYKTPPKPPQHPPSLSIEALLSVPLPFIFRQTDSNNNNNNGTSNRPDYLLSRVEATILLQISQLAHEMDTLTSMTLQALDKSRIVRDLHRSIHSDTTDSGGGGGGSSSNHNIHYLRSITPLLHTHGRTIPQRVLQHVQIETERNWKRRFVVGSMD